MIKPGAKWSVVSELTSASLSGRTLGAMTRRGRTVRFSLDQRRPTTMTNESHNDEIDQAIFARQIIQAIGLIRARDACGLHVAIEKVSVRYKELRESAPECFTVGHEEYWKGFYS